MRRCWADSKQTNNVPLAPRELVGWGPTDQTLTEPTLRRARAMAEAWDEAAERCDIDTPAHPASAQKRVA